MKKKSGTVRDEIRKGFLRMLSMKPYAEITVSDLVKEAGVARVSYYRNYKSFEDILADITDWLYRDYHGQIMPLLLSNDKEELTTAVKRHLQAILHIKPYVNETLRQNSSLIFSRLHEKLDKIEGRGLSGKYDVFAKMGIINSVGDRWMQLGATESVEELSDYIVERIAF